MDGKTSWQFVCKECDAVGVEFHDFEDDDAPVTCRTCGVSFGTLGEMKRQMAGASQGIVDPEYKLGFRKIETKH